MAQEYAKNQNVIKYGAYGSKCPENFSLVLEGSETIKEVIIRHGFIVDAIGFVIAQPSGNTITKMFGGNCGDKSKIVLKCGEYVIQISGTYGNYRYQHNQCVIATIKIHTNLRPTGYGPYGQGRDVQNVQCFSSPYPIEGHIMGYFGRHNNYLEGVGILIKKKQTVMKLGPYGSQCAENFNMLLEGSESIKQVIIRHGDVVDAIGFVIAKPHGNTITKMFGGNCGEKRKVELQHDEYITHISGTYGDYKRQNYQSVIATIKIHTNFYPKGYGPYGKGHLVENVRWFSSPYPTGGTVVGYFGRHKNYLESIGIFVKKESTSA